MVAFCPSNFELRVEGEVRILEPKSYRLLAFLMEHPGRVVSRGEILREVWTDTSVTDNALSRTVGQIRKALKDNPKESRYIETIPTVGYRFIGTLLPEDLVSSSTAPVSPFPNGSHFPATTTFDAVHKAPLAEAATLRSTIERQIRGRNMALVIGAGLIVVASAWLLFLRDANQPHRTTRVQCGSRIEAT